jgi:hypothetical protein
VEDLQVERCPGTFLDELPGEQGERDGLPVPVVLGE